MRYLAIVLFSFALLISSASPATAEERVLAREGLIKQGIASPAFGESRPVLIGLPASYEVDGDRRYPVLYVLNEEENSLWASQIATALGGRQIHEVIVVGLPSANTYGRDNYPFLNGSSREPNEWAVKHQTFLRDEVVPFIEAKYRTSGRFIAGHSLSGLFVTHLFINDPAGFDVHIAISPSYHNAPQIIDAMKERLASGDQAAGALHLTIGAQEHPLIQDKFAAMTELLKASAPEGLVWEAASLPDTEHQAAGFGGLYGGLTWIYRGLFNPDLDHGLDGTIAHYAAMSDLVGYEVKPVENNILGAAGFYLARMNDPQKSLTAYRAAHYFYPNNARARDALAIVEPWFEGGAPALRKAIEAGSKLDEAAIVDVGRSLLGAGRKDEAVSLLEIGAELYPESSTVSAALAAAKE